MKKCVVLVLLLGALIFALPACASDKANENSTTPTIKEAVQRVTITEKDTKDVAETTKAEVETETMLAIAETTQKETQAQIIASTTAVEIKTTTLETTEKVVVMDYSGWVIYNTDDLELLVDNMLRGYVVYRNEQYWASPEYVNMISNEEIVYENDISENDGSNPPRNNELTPDSVFETE